MKKRVLAIVALAAVAAVVLAGCGRKVPAGAVAAVGNGVVTQAQYDSIVNMVKAQYKNNPSSGSFPKNGSAQYKQLSAEIVKYLVNVEIVNQQAHKNNITATTKEIDAQIATLKAQVGGEKKFQAMLKQQGMTMAYVTSYVKNQILTTKLHDKVIKAVKAPTEQEIRDYYNKHKSEFSQAATRQVRHILAKTEALARTVRALLVADPSDANWKKLAAKYSLDTATKSKGGELGLERKGYYVTAFDTVVWSLKANVISQPIHTQFGWHVLEVEKIVAATSSSYASQKNTVKQMLVYSKQSDAWNKWVKDVTKKANIRYAAGYDPAKLVPSSSPSPSAT